jgi:transcriptional regulator GlxA family with amidase domain
MTFGILLFEGVEELDFVGPWEMLGMWSMYAEGPKNCLTVAQTNDVICCAKGLKVVADYDFENCPELTYLLVPGGFSVFEELKNKKLIDFIKQKASKAKYVLSVCSGSFLLHKAELLEGKSVTTHWKAQQQLSDIPEINIVSERYVQDGNIWTSAGVSAGIDMMLSFIENIAGEEAASIVQMNAEYYPEAKVYGDTYKNLSHVNYIKNLINSEE